MNKRVFSIIGVLALLAWTLGGVAAWALTKEGLQITIQQGSTKDQGNDRMALMEDRLGALQKDLGGLAHTLGRNLQLLQDNLSEEGSERGLRSAQRIAKLERELAALRAERRKDQAALAKRSERMFRDLKALALEGAGSRSPAGGDPVTGTHANESTAEEEVAKAEVTPQVKTELPKTSQPKTRPHETTPVMRGTKAPGRAKKKRGFLSFDLPSQRVVFDARQRWKIVPSLSRVGFDGKSTLHDFSGVTSKLGGSLEVDLAHPDKNPKTSIHVQAARLKTGVDGRDEEMYTTLDVKKHPQITFELNAFTSKTVDAAKERVTGIAKGEMTIHGVSQDVEMLTTLSIDSSRRLHIDGEMPLDLTDYKITPPSKMGLVGMDKRIKVWIRLRARIQEHR